MVWALRVLVSLCRRHWIAWPILGEQYPSIMKRLIWALLFLVDAFEPFRNNFFGI